MSYNPHLAAKVVGGQSKNLGDREGQRFLRFLVVRETTLQRQPRTQTSLTAIAACRPLLRGFSTTRSPQEKL